MTHSWSECYSMSKLYSCSMMYLRFPVSIFPKVSLGIDQVASAKQPWMLSSVISCLFNPISVTILRYLCLIMFHASSMLLNYELPVGVYSSLKCYSSQAIKGLFLWAKHKYGQLLPQQRTYQRDYRGIGRAFSLVLLVHLSPARPQHLSWTSWRLQC